MLDIGSEFYSKWTQIKTKLQVSRIVNLPGMESEIHKHNATQIKPGI